MKLIKNTYKTFTGEKEIIDLDKKNGSEWLIYLDGEPKYHVDLYDLSIESNSMMNSLVLCAKRTMKETLTLLNKKNNTNLSLPKAPKLGYQVKTEKVKLELESLPEKWLDYSL